MKSIHKISALLLPFALLGCKWEAQAPVQPIEPNRITAAKAQRAIMQENEQLGKALIQAQDHDIEQEKDRDRWKTIAFLLMSGCVIALFTGAILGSGAKKNA
jgi:apolipoprotein N-acyltransferase